MIRCANVLHSEGVCAQELKVQGLRPFVPPIIVVNSMNLG